MEKDKKILNEQELGKVNGGSHLDSDEVEALKAGTRLIIEDKWGKDVGACIYNGNTRDGANFYNMTRLYVQLTEIYDEWIIKCLIYEEDNLDEHDLARLPNPKVGDIVTISRWNLDFPERA